MRSAEAPGVALGQAADIEFMQVSVTPAHGGLYDGMHVGERCVEWHDEPPPDPRLDIVEGDMHLHGVEAANAWPLSIIGILGHVFSLRNRLPLLPLGTAAWSPARRSRAQGCPSMGAIVRLLAPCYHAWAGSCLWSPPDQSYPTAMSPIPEVVPAIDVSEEKMANVGLWDSAEALTTTRTESRRKVDGAGSETEPDRLYDRSEQARRCPDDAS